MMQIIDAETESLHVAWMVAASEVRPAAQERAQAFDPPGGILLWIIVFVETATFGAALVAFAVSRREEPAIFAAGHATLNQPLALANTLLLLTGGWLMARGLGSLRAGESRAAARWIAGAIGSGGLFLALKSVEYVAKLGNGLGLHHDTFFTYYWLLTSFHVMHVVLAVGLLAFAWRAIRGGRYSATDHLAIESIGIFWHMCDVIWLLLYPTIYLLG